MYFGGGKKIFIMLGEKGALTFSKKQIITS
jgi:hypothetical protein